MSNIEIFVNSENRQIDANTKLAELMDQLQINTQGIAVALNNAVIPKNDWQQYPIKEKDNIIIIKATQGG